MYRNDRALPQLVERVEALLADRLPSTREWRLDQRELQPGIIALVLRLPAYTYLSADPVTLFATTATTQAGVAVSVAVDMQSLMTLDTPALQDCAHVLVEGLMDLAGEHGGLPGRGGNPP
jgi:hypothetical protein